MKSAVILIFLTLGFLQSEAYSGIAIQSEASEGMQVYVNGKLFNREPGKFVRIKSEPGLFHLEVRVRNPQNGRWYLVKKDVRIEKGMEFFYKVTFAKDSAPEIREVRRYPVYNRYILNSSLYNRHPST